MCAPMAALGAVMSIGSAVAGGMAQDSANKADYEAKSAVWRQNVVNSEAAARDEHRQILNQQMQEQEKTGQKKHVSYIEEAQKRGTAEAQAAGSGVGGQSVDNILADITSKSLLNRTYADRNYEFVAAETTEKLKSTEARLMSRINSVERPVSKASTAGIVALGAIGKSFGSLGLGG